MRRNRSERMRRPAGDGGLSSHESRWLDRLTDDALQQASSASILERGRDYASDGSVHVRRLTLAPSPSVDAVVTGSERYVVRLQVHASSLRGTCTCPNAADGWFCKHQVAVALVLRDRLEAPAWTSTSRGASGLEPVAEVDERAALEEFLTAQPHRALVERLMRLADEDFEIERELHAWRALNAAETNISATDALGLIERILATDGRFIERREATSWARRAEGVLPLLRKESGRSPVRGLDCTRRALTLAWAALQDADDSDGAMGEVCAAIGAAWLDALRAAGPRPAAFGEAYLELLLADPISSFDAEAAERALGAEALARFRSVLAARWRNATDTVLASKARSRPTRTGHPQEAQAFRAPDIESRAGVWSLEHHHLRQLDAQGDIEGALGVLRADLSSGHAFGRVTAFLERHDRMPEALANARQACAAFPDDDRVQEDLARCLVREGAHDEVLALRRRQFEQAPSVERYRLVLDACRAAGADRAALRTSLLRWVEDEEIRHFTARTGPRASVSSATAKPGRDVRLRVGILAAERRWAEADALLDPPDHCAASLLRAVALHLPPNRRGRAVALLERVLAQRMEQASSPYRDELALVNEVLARVGPADHAEWLERLRTKYRTKRNFVRGLPNGHGPSSR